ncbi:uncharacterized protein TNCV_2588601 [Trichonephila clavipes]|nr:uncharacterized protein TNCV_2588601 [Trichonephila clavipes]
MYAQIKRDGWNKLSSSLDSRSYNSKLWKLVKGISKEQPQIEKCNTIQSTDRLLAQNDEQAVNILEEHYQLISSMNFTGNDKYAKTMASNVVHGCRSNPHVGPAIFSRTFSAQELDAAILGLNLNTSPGPASIQGQMISHLGPPLKRLLEAESSSSRLEKSDCGTY